MSDKIERNIGAIVLVSCVVAGLIIYVLMSYMFVEYVPNRVKTPDAQSPTVAENVTPSPEEIKQKTDILQSSVYNSDGEVLGVLYDAYLDPKTGEVEWVSLKVAGNEGPPLVVLRASKIETLNDTGPLIMNITKDEFMNYPAQKRHEDELVGFISLRSLPGTVIFSGDDERRIGTLESVSYVNGKIDMVYFEVTTPLSKYPDNQDFMIPFEHLKFTNLNNLYNKGVGISLTERQAGAIEAYANIKDVQ